MHSQPRCDLMGKGGPCRQLKKLLEGQNEQQQVERREGLLDPSPASVAGGSMSRFAVGSSGFEVT